MRWEGKSEPPGAGPAGISHIHRRAPSSQPQGSGRVGRREEVEQPGCLRSRRPPSRPENNVSANSKHWGAGVALRGLAFEKALKKPSGAVPQLGKSVFGDGEEWEGVSRKWCSVSLGLRGLHWGRCYEGPRLNDCHAWRAAEAPNAASRGFNSVERLWGRVWSHGGGTVFWQQD